MLDFFHSWAPCVHAMYAIGLSRSSYTLAVFQMTVGNMVLLYYTLNYYIPFRYNCIIFLMNVVPFMLITDKCINLETMSIPLIMYIRGRT